MEDILSHRCAFLEDESKSLKSSYTKQVSVEFIFTNLFIYLFNYIFYLFIYLLIYLFIFSCQN